MSTRRESLKWYADDSQRFRSHLEELGGTENIDFRKGKFALKKKIRCTVYNYFEEPERFIRDIVRLRPDGYGEDSNGETWWAVRRKS